ncbi:DEAD/DEAH box helicase [Egicoccus halophilus]|uniref:Superfamily II DNA and RNA helicase n=1 Tax=Egicoccus halophilus TaxID=1670830 RepID=A0A8J3AAR6_9ACTN|nr:DEAD/DEAH box helicase [Egicoccus halophilus]GGI08813.1 hypothetical protein GCM10011354_30960 [Egicoccus halophilus]
MTKTFRDLGVDAALCDALEAQGIIHPFPIQELTLPLALGRNDLIAQARTGTGKTLGFGLPLLQQVDADLRATQALVIVPTRELCVQVHDDLRIGEHRDLTTISVYGGVGFEEQTAALQGGVHVVVGTPGRLLDHLKRGNLDLSQVKVLVLDEADEMLDMGFLPDVERLIERCPAEGRHTMLFSATMPTAIVKMARRYLHHPTFMRADSEEHETAPNVAQHFFSVHRMDKPRVLARILQSPGRGRCYVFVRTKNMADRLVNDLEELQVPAIAIHGDLRQQTREKNLDRFRSGKADVLVATEVAARGIDVTGVTHVVNYDCPDDEKMYLHRIGRTARAGNAGVAVTFAEFNEAGRLNVIRKAVGATDTDVHQIFSTSPMLAELFDLPDDKPWDHLSRRPRDGGDGGGRRTDGPRKGRSDGRPKNRRDREGSGRDRDAARDRPRDPDAGRAADAGRGDDRSGGRPDRPGRDSSTRDDRGRNDRTRDDRGRDDDAARDSSARDAKAGDASAGDTSARDRTRDDRTRDDRGRDDRDRGDRSGQNGPEEAPSPTGRSRERTRVRRRDRDEAAQGRDERRDRDDAPRTRDEPRDDANPADRDDASRPSAGSGRTRARAGARARTRDDAAPSRGRPRDADAGRASSDADGDANGDEPASRSRNRARRGERSDTSGRDRGGRSRGTDRDDTEGSTGEADTGGGRDDRSGRRGTRGDNRSANTRSGGSGSGGNRSGGSRSGNSRSKGKGGGGQRGDDRQQLPPVPGLQVARRGAEARGDGDPQLARRVKVEHLP